MFLRRAAEMMLVLVPVALQAQQVVITPPAVAGRLAGHVTCGDTGLPGRGATVALVPSIETTKPEQAPANEARVTAPGQPPMPTQRWLAMVRAKTMMDGSFVIDELPVGDYYVAATMPGYSIPLKAGDDQRVPFGERIDPRKALADFKVVRIEANRTTDVELSMTRGATVTGRVTYDDGSPAVGVGVSVRRSEGKDPLNQYLGPGLFDFGAPTTSITDDDGRYRIAGLLAGKYVVQASMGFEKPTRIAGLSTGSQRMSRADAERQQVNFYAPDAVHRTDAKVVELHSGEQARDVDVVIRLNALHKVDGRVLALSDRHALSQFDVTLKDSSDNAFSITVIGELDGSFHMDYVPAGTYELTASGRDIEATRVATENRQVPYDSVKETVVLTDQDAKLDEVLLPKRKPQKSDAGLEASKP